MGEAIFDHLAKNAGVRDQVSQIRSLLAMKILLCHELLSYLSSGWLIRRQLVATKLVVGSTARLKKSFENTQLTMNTLLEK